MLDDLLAAPAEEELFSAAQSNLFSANNGAHPNNPPSLSVVIPQQAEEPFAADANGDRDEAPEAIPPYLSEEQVKLAELLVAAPEGALDTQHFLQVVREMPPGELDDRLQQIHAWSEQLTMAQTETLARAEAIGLF